MRTFVLTTLGRVELSDTNGAPVTTLLVQPKRLALLVYLAVAAPGGMVRRDLLCELFWPDVTTERARTSLRQALAFLRRALGDDALESRGDDDVGVNDRIVHCDAVRVRALLPARPDGARRIAESTEALALYGGEFMPGFDPADIPRVSRWLDDVRSALARDAGAAAVHLAREMTARGDVAEAVTLARRAMEITPFDEVAFGTLLTALDASGDRADALLAYDVFARRLAEELESEPAAETVALMARIRARETPVREAALPETVAVMSPPGAPPASAPLRDGPRVPTARRWWLMASAGVVLLVAGLLLRAERTTSHGSAPADEPRRMLVTPFVNETDDASLDPVGRMAADWITEGLSRIEGIAVVPGTAVLAMERAREPIVADAAADPRAGMIALARETGATIVVSGSYYRTGGTLHLQARVTDGAFRALLRPAETVSVPVDSIVAGVDRMRVRLLAGLAPLVDTTMHARYANPPPSYEAWRDMLHGFERFVAQDLDEALAAFERSAERDTTYLMPRLAAAITHQNLGDLEAAHRIAESLMPQRDRLGPVEQGTLDMIRGMLHGDLPAVYTVVRRTARITPGSINEYMVAEAARRLNRPEEAVRVLRALGPDRGELRGWRPYWRELCYALHMLGDFEAVLATARAGRVRHPDDPGMLAYQIRALAALGHTDSVLALLEEIDARPGSLREGVGGLLRTAAAEPGAGLPERTRLLADRAVAWYAREQQRDPHTARWRTGYVRALRLAARDTDAASMLDSLMARDSMPTAMLRDLGVLAARAGDTAAAVRWDGELERRQALLADARRGTSWPELQLDRAAIAAQRGETERAVSMLREAFARGLSFGPVVSADPDLAPLRAHAGYRAMMRPAG